MAIFTPPPPPSSTVIKTQPPPPPYYVIKAAPPPPPVIKTKPLPHYVIKPNPPPPPPSRKASPLQLELGSGSSACCQRYVSRMTWIENFLSQNFSKFFWKPLFSTIHATLFIIEMFFSKLVKMKILITKSTKIVQLILRKLVKNQNFDYVINDQTPPPPPPVINRKHLETPPPSADYVICERPHIIIFVPK